MDHDKTELSARSTKTIRSHHNPFINWPGDGADGVAPAAQQYHIHMNIINHCFKIETLE